MNQDQHTHLIIKALNGEISPQEDVAMKNWLSSDVGNQKLYDQMETAWKEARHYKKSQKVDKAAAWDKISSTIVDSISTASAKEAKTVKLFNPFKLAIAASFLILVGAALYLFQPSGNRGLEFETFANTTAQSKEVKLMDGSIVSLAEHSSITIPKGFQQRDVELTGKAHFDVTHDSERPFVVKAMSTSTTVLGTQFIVDTKVENEVVVSLLEGKVAFEAPHQEQIILNPGEAASYSNKSKRTSKNEIKNNNILSWKDLYLKFEETKLSQVVKELESYFKVKIQLEIPVEDCVFTGTFKNPKLSDILEIMSFTYQMTHQEVDKIHYIKVSNCN